MMVLISSNCLGFAFFILSAMISCSRILPISEPVRSCKSHANAMLNLSSIAFVGVLSPVSSCDIAACDTLLIDDNFVWLRPLCTLMNFKFSENIDISLYITLANINIPTVNAIITFAILIL